MRVVRLGDVVSINPRGDAVGRDESVSFVGMAELDAETAIAHARETRSYAEVSRGYTVFRDRDVLVAKITPCWENGKVGQARLDHSVGVGSTEFHVIRPGSTVDGRYLLYYLRQSTVRRAGELRMTGSGGQRRVPAAFLQHLEFSLPAIQEQRRIAAILDQVEEVRVRRRQVLAHLDVLPGAIFREMFGDADADVLVKDQATSMRTGPFGSQLLHSEFATSGVAVLGLDNVVRNEFEWVGRRYINSAKYDQLKRYTVRPGDVLISIMGTTGRCVVVPDDIPPAINTKHICALTMDRERMDPVFVRAAFLWHPESRAHLRRQTKGSIMDGLNMGIIKSMPIPSPPLRRQQEFRLRIEQVTDRLATVRRAAAADHELFASLQSRAFRGEL